MSQATDLQRQIDQLDGIVGGEGQGATKAAVTLPSAIQPLTSSFSSSLLGSAATGQQQSVGSLRSAARNSSSLTALSNLFNPPAQSTSSLVDLIA